MTVNHATGLVAPVSKTVSYGTVTNIPGATSKCWITSNLGADHQATAKDDATEASAGWYWQFNKKQGYKQDGSTVTPAWTITSISENSDWLLVNDPCALELGFGWRIPTSTEWTNIQTAGSWTNWTMAWNSALKLHAAGFVLNDDGSIDSRGTLGDFWSSMQNDASIAWYANAYSTSSSLGAGFKSSGISVRCIKD